MNRVVKRPGILVTFQGFRGSSKSWTMHFMETFYVLVLLYVTICHVHLYMNVCIYIHICLYIYTHILYRCCKANGVAFISACPLFKALGAAFDDFVNTYMTICVSYTNTWCKEFFVAFVASGHSRRIILRVPSWTGIAIFSLARFFYFPEKLE